MVEVVSLYNAKKQACTDIKGLFEQARLDESCTCVFRNYNIELLSDVIYENSSQIEMFSI